MWPGIQMGGGKKGLMRRVLPLPGRVRSMTGGRPERQLIPMVRVRRRVLAARRSMALGGVPAIVATPDEGRWS